MAGEPETLHEAARRLRIIADYLCHRFDAKSLLVAPFGVTNDIMAMRFILDRIEREVESMVPSSNPPESKR